MIPVSGAAFFVSVAADCGIPACRSCRVPGVFLMTCRVRRAPRVILVFATAFVVFSIAGSTASAQQGGRGSQDLYTLVEQAQAHVVAGRWQSAIDTYLEAWKLSRDPGYLYNISVLYLVRLKDEAKALDYAERYLEQARSDSEKAEAEGLIRRIKSSISDTHGKLIIEVMPKDLDAIIYVDGQVLADDSWVTAGRHVLGAQAQGYVPFSQEITVEPGTEFRLTVRMKTIEGLLEVKCDGGPCNVSIDGEGIGAGPVSKKLGPGEHSVEIEAGGAQVFSDWVTVESGMQKTLTVSVDDGRTDVASQSIGDEPEGVVDDTGKLRDGRDRGSDWVMPGGSGGGKIGPQKAGAISMWVLSALAAGAGTGMYFYAQKKLDDAGALRVEDYPNYAYYEWYFDKNVSDAELYSYIAYGSWGLSGAALAIGLALWFTAPADNPVTVLPAGPDGPGATFVMRW